jgi:PAS domain S-box-containing protein
VPFTVLVVDDDPDTRVNLRDILELDGYDVEAAGTAAEALARDDWDRYGAVLLDRRLPDGTAEELLPVLRERAPEAAVVVVTGHADVRAAIEAFRLGAADYALKPVDPDELRTRLGRIAGHHKAREALRHREEELKAVLDALPVGVWFTDDAGTIVYGNPAARAIWGGAAHAGVDGVEGRKGWWPGSRRRVEPGEWALARALKGEPALDEVVEIEAGDGARKVVLTSAVPLRDGGNAVRGAVVINQDVTDRKRAEDARLHFQALFESAPGMYLVLDPDLTIVGASDAYLKATMTERERIVGRNLFDVFPDNPDDPTADGVRNLRASLDRVRANRVADVMAVQRYPVRRPEAAGGGFEERHWSPLNSPVFGPGGELAYILHRVEDVTDYVHAQERGEVFGPQLESRAQSMQAEIYLRAQELARANRALRESEELFRGAFEDTHVATALAALNGWLLRTNAAFDQLFAHPPASAAALRLAELTHPDDRAVYQAGRDDLKAGQARSFQREVRYVRQGGEVFWGLTNVALVRDAHGLPARFVVQVQDVTERKRAEEALRESERRFRELLEKVQLIAVMLDTDGRATFCNDFLLGLTGWRAEEVLGQSWFDVFVPEDQRAELKRIFFDPVLREEIPAHYENEILTRSGERRLVAWNNTVLRDAGGRLIGTTSLGEDITERRRAEAGLRAKTEELKATTQQLWQAARLAGVGELAASIAHELNNPLGIVTLRLEGVLAKTPAEDPRRRALDVVDGEVQRMAALVANLLGFSRAGREQVSAVDLREEATKTIELIEHHLRKRQVQAETDFAPAAPSVHADRQQVRQVLLNLLTNAGDAMPGGGRLTVRVHPAELDGRPAAVIEVTDTGTGIPAEHLSGL